MTAPGLKQVLTFCVGGETYGIDILCVHEIRGWSPVTRLPQSPPQVLGVLNLRGAIVPVIDLRVRFGLAHAAFTALTVIIVLSVHGAQGKREWGLVVDSVSDVLAIDPDTVKEPPPVGGAVSGDIQGLATVADRLVILLEPERLVTEEWSA